jgi:hypothetical protein
VILRLGQVERVSSNRSEQAQLPLLELNNNITCRMMSCGENACCCLAHHRSTKFRSEANRGQYIANMTNRSVFRRRCDDDYGNVEGLPRVNLASLRHMRACGLIRQLPSHTLNVDILHISIVLT